MENHVLTEGKMMDFRMYLVKEERAASTIEKYMRDIRAFFDFLPTDKVVTKELVLNYKQELSGQLKATSANSKLAALNSLFACLDWMECRVRLFKVQRKTFRNQEKELNRQEYLKLIQAAKNHDDERLCFLLQTICSTGIRVSEHQFITVAALHHGHANVVNKGKERDVILPKELCGILLEYCKRKGISDGPVFVTRTGKPMDRCNIWSEMKALCEEAGVEHEKVYPHNLRHLFAVTYYQLDKDVVRLADILGHASVETTRIYTATSGMEQVRTLSRMKLII